MADKQTYTVRVTVQIDREYEIEAEDAEFAQTIAEDRARWEFAHDGGFVSGSWVER